MVVLKLKVVGVKEGRFDLKSGGEEVFMDLFVNCGHILWGE
jgi:hypothetical protein